MTDRMELPEMVTVLGIPYKIEHVDIVNRDDVRFGETRFFDGVIRIDKSLPLEIMNQTLIHEILHCICWEQGLYEIGENENAIQSLATALYDTLKNNNIIFS